jgi:hypothetical protein
MGPDTEGIRYGGIRNIVQVIVVDAATGKVADFLQVSRSNDSEASTKLTVSNLWAGERYHFLVLMGHRERDYAAEKANALANPSNTDYVYTAGVPTLLAAGFLGGHSISGAGTITVTMKPVVVDTVFEYGGVTAQAALGGTELPSGVGASLVWTITGGYGTLLEAQAKRMLGIGGEFNSNWGELTLAGQKTIFRLTGQSDTEAPAVLSGAEPDRPGPRGARSGDLRFGQLQFNLRPLWVRHKCFYRICPGGDSVDPPQRGERRGTGREHGLYRQSDTLGRHAERQRGRNLSGGAPRDQPEWSGCRAGGRGDADNVLLHFPV